MRSDVVKKGESRAPHRSLFKAAGLTEEEIERPLIGVVTSQNDIVPGHIHLNQIVEGVKKLSVTNCPKLSPIAFLLFSIKFVCGIFSPNG